MNAYCHGDHDRPFVYAAGVMPVIIRPTSTNKSWRGSWHASSNGMYQGTSESAPKKR